jgi:hypothetical protein
MEVSGLPPLLQFTGTYIYISIPAPTGGDKIINAMNERLTGQNVSLFGFTSI